MEEINATMGQEHPISDPQHEADDMLLTSALNEPVPETQPSQGKDFISAWTNPHVSKKSTFLTFYTINRSTRAFATNN